MTLNKLIHSKFCICLNCSESEINEMGLNQMHSIYWADMEMFIETNLNVLKWR